MKDFLRAVWEWLKWPVIVLAGAYFLLVVWDVHRLFELDKTNAAVAAIHAQKITLADVMGEALPPVPDQAENDATVAGIDKNNNGVRDDVELAIFKKYPNSAKVRAAELQYAASIQTLLTKAYNTDTWVAAVKEYSQAYACVSKSYPDNDFRAYIKVTDARISEVDALVINTKIRTDAQDRAYDFSTSYGDLPGEPCDIDLKSLPN